MAARDIKSLTLKELEEVLNNLGEKSFHAQQVFSWIYQKAVADFAAMSDLPLGLRRVLKENFYIRGLKLRKRLKAGDRTQKFLLQLTDRNLLEAVIIPAEGRVTGCISTQAGCKFACCFCASGLLGFKRNLTATEMLDEVLYLKDYAPQKRLTHIVFMGTGEPFDNYDELLKAVRTINSPQGLNIGSRRMTISTCGIIPGIKKLAEENLQVELSVSLHAGDDKTRSLIMPINKKYHLKELIAACRYYIAQTNRQITFEYILIKDINSDLQNAINLSKILRSLKLCKVNVIPCNPVKELKVEPPEQEEILSFRKHLLKSGLNVTLRTPRGEDIEAACGQLRLRYEK
ncbi:MAG: 23S rRNA (adenine(2503)-C(2))-methyltransferase RlmN [Candidatus Omnitrophica bacterium]|nr:23S rRNA (adenine(2503)-C(2))-methyltransferase RlmN [Candidatus Omnitrophota bacterium]